MIRWDIIFWLVVSLVFWPWPQFGVSALAGAVFLMFIKDNP